MDLGERPRRTADADQPRPQELVLLPELGLEELVDELPVRALAEVRLDPPAASERVFPALGDEGDRAPPGPRDERLERRRLPGLLRLARDDEMAERNVHGLAGPDFEAQRN